MSRFICALLMLSVGAAACWQTDDEPTRASYVAPMTTSTPDRSPAATSTPRVYEVPTAASASPFPTAAPASTPTPTPSAIHVAPSAAPTPTDEDLERMSNFMDNWKSISYRATFNVTDDRFTESGYLIAADVKGWVTVDPESQMFVRIDMTRPVERSIEVLTHNSFDIYLNDLDAGKWYFVPENSDAGPLEDILQLYSWGLAYSVLPTSSFEQSADGYVVTQGDPSFVTVTASYDQAYTLRSVVLSDTEGKEALRVSFFDLNKPQEILPYQKGERLPEDYWEPAR